MSINTIYLASGSTPENDTRMVGNILLAKEEKDNLLGSQGLGTHHWTELGPATVHSIHTAMILSKATRPPRGRGGSLTCSQSWSIFRCHFHTNSFIYMNFLDYIRKKLSDDDKESYTFY